MNGLMPVDNPAGPSGLAEENQRLRKRIRELEKEKALLRQFVNAAKRREWERLDRQRQADRARARSLKRRGRRIRALLAAALTIANIWRMAQ